ncbi:hypothetical protein [Okeania sp. KiyG1]|uniref:hypothetical protein n=1 Tax=Okeania sp. KiyG1 TaxID=2720165 RepID=UPI0019240584|nr:hypothetical protein [Okeania sp. KiyG1]GGA25786.1 hypothetical protein CYANOKiyG1_41640 [Okeania sp. KiyG1]
MLKIAIDGLNAVQFTEEILAIEGIEGSYEIVGIEREADLATIATIVGIGAGTSVMIINTLNIAEKISQCFKKHETKLEKVEFVSKNGNRVILHGATVEQIKDILESFLKK